MTAQPFIDCQPRALGYEQQSAARRAAYQQAQNDTYLAMQDSYVWGTKPVPFKEKVQMNSCKEEVLPDISLVRVFKWAIVLLVALALGRRVWEMFGDKIKAQVEKSLG